MNINYIIDELKKENITISAERIKQIIRKNELSLGRGAVADVPLDLAHLIIDYYIIKTKLNKYKENK